MTGKIKIKLSYISEADKDNKYPSEQQWYEQIANEDWLAIHNPDFLQKVIAAFNGVEWKKNEY